MRDSVPASKEHRAVEATHLIGGGGGPHSEMCEIKLGPLAVRTQSPNHWAPRECLMLHV